MTTLHKMLEQTAQLHRQFLEGQEAAQRTVHLLVEQQQRLLQAALGLPVTAPPPAALPAARQESPPPATVAPAPVSQVRQESVAAPGADAPGSPGQGEVEGVLLAVVAQKTGYPAEMLELDMALDGDLGIDSIKRVEILSALQERLPEAPAVRPEHLGSLLTLRHIAAFLAGRGEPGRAGGVSPLLAAEQGADAPRSPQTALERFALRAVPLAGTRPAVSVAAGAEFWVACEETELARCLEQRLAQRGYRPRHVLPADLPALACPAALGGLLLIAPARQPGDDLLKNGLLCLKHLAAALRQGGSQGGAVLATVSRLDGAFGLRRIDPRREPLDGGLAGLAKTAGQEWPEVACKGLDLAADLALPEAAAAIVEELFLAGPPEVGLSGAGRVTLEMAPLAAPVQGGPSPLQPGDVVVVSGGARGVTAEVALALARQFRPTLILLGRTPAPQPEPDWLAALGGEADIKRELARRNGLSPREAGEQCRQVLAAREAACNLDRLRAAGASAYRAVDVRDARAVAEVLAAVRGEFGPVRGLIHGAGVLADARIEDKTAEQFERVYATKVDGLRALLSALEPDDLRALVLFSSSTARFGRTGQVDYASANEVLNKEARRQAALRPTCRVLALDWGPWEGGMVTPTLRKVFAEEGVGLIPLEAGAQLVVEELRGPLRPEVEMVVLAAGTRPPSAPALPPALPTAFERVLELADFPVLSSHVLDGRPVVPVVLILEWLAHAALHQNPGLSFHGCDELRVLHGVVLGGPPPRVRVGAGKAVKRDGLFVAPAELRGVGPDGREVLHARAEVVLAADLPPTPTAQDVAPLPDYDLAPHEVYEQGLLFHGPLMQAIQRIDGVGPTGACGWLRAAATPAEWVRQPLRNRWLADPPVLDGAFQLMILWTLRQHGSVALPCYLRRYRQWRRAFPAGGALASARVTRSSDLHALADVDFLDEEGRLIARLEGYESVLDPNLRRAFRRNQLAVP
jgi:NAD(P)-dependent dehydrogenase (short-subunit alcohol dehydrogenase family)